MTSYSFREVAFSTIGIETEIGIGISYNYQTPWKWLALTSKLSSTEMGSKRIFHTCLVTYLRN